MPGGGAFERFRSKCGGNKSDTNNNGGSGFNGKNKNKKSILKKKIFLKRLKKQKKANAIGQKISIQNFILEQNIKNANCNLINNELNFNDSIKVAVKLSQDKQQIQNVNDEKDSINVERGHSDRVTKLNKYGVKGFNLDR